MEGFEIILEVKWTEVAYGLVFGTIMKFLPSAASRIIGSLPNTGITGRDTFVGSRT